MYKIRLENTVTHHIYEQMVEDINGGDKLYFLFSVDTVTLDNGEYVLSLYDEEDTLLCEEILRIGDFNSNALQYSKGDNTYIEFVVKTIVQNRKNVSIDSVQATILPDTGNDAMGSVVVDAQPLYDRALNEGKELGIIEQKEKLTAITINENGVYENENGYNEIVVSVPDLNGSYDEGYSEGYDTGKSDGITEQKAKLESINITENGTYSREDGYNSITVEVADLNGSYDEGYKDGYDEGVEEGVSNAGGIIAETARVLNVTENGVYTSKYTKEEEIVMPFELWGDDFYNYAYVKNKIWNTGIIPNKNTRLEFWWRPDVTDRVTRNSGVVIGTDYLKTYNWGITHNVNGDSSYNATIDYYNADINFRLTDNVFYHIIMSLEDGLIINGELIGTFSNGGNKSKPLYINGVPDDVGGSEDGTYGMIKIDDIVIIPTKDGFLNTNTGELLEVVCDGDYEYTEISQPAIEGNLYRTINVNVAPQISVLNNNLKFAYSGFDAIPEWADFKGVVSMQRMFSNCSNLAEVRMIDISSVTDMYYCFYSCGALAYFLPSDTRNVTNMSRMFDGCNSLKKVSALDARSVVRQSYGLFGSGTLNNLTDFGGLIGLKASIDGNYGFEKCPNLTYESCINILNGLYDFTGNGIAPASNEGKLKVHSNFLTTVGDEISIGINKGWTITA